MQIPQIGLGFWQIRQEDAGQVLLSGVSAGYRHIDTAIAYSNESQIGTALKECGVPREQLFITSKVPAEIKTYEEAKKAIDESLARLDCGYLDLMLIHAPKPWSQMYLPGPRYHKGNLAVWQALCEAKAAGKIKEIGVSNFNIADLKNILAHSQQVPFANQIRVHVGHVNKKLIAFCQQHGILVEAYSPSGTGRLLHNKSVAQMAQKYGVSSAQLCVQYDVQLGLIPLPRSKNPAHIQQNITLDFTISPKDMAKLGKIRTF